MDRQVNPGFGDGFLVPGHPFRDVVAHADNEYMDAPRGPVEFEESDELERLRRRAYGPDADIAGDAAAQARLSELEAAQRRQATPVVDAAAGVPAGSAEPVPVAGARRGACRNADSDPRRPEPPRHRGGAAAAVGDPRRRHRDLALNVAHSRRCRSCLLMSPLPSRPDTSTAKALPVPVGRSRGDDVPAPDHVLALRSVGAAADQPRRPEGNLDALGISPG